MSTRLSKSALEKFRACPKCFYLEKNASLKQPQGIRAGVPMGIDRVLKGHYDAHRELKTVPPELVGKIPGGLYDGHRVSMKDLRNWRAGLTVVEDGSELSTALDDLLFDAATGLYNMIDYKSKAKLTDVADTQKYYQVQADCYDLALNANKYPTDGRCFFAYYAPITVGQTIATQTNEGCLFPFTWHCQVIEIKANHANAKDLLKRAAACLAGKEPAAGVDCEYCNFVEARNSHVGVMA